MRHRSLTLLLVTALLISACGGGDDDLRTAVADDVRGAALTSAPAIVTEPQEQPAVPAPVTAPVQPKPVPEPGRATASASTTVKIGAPTPDAVADSVSIGDVPTSTDTPQRAPVAEPPKVAVEGEPAPGVGAADGAEADTVTDAATDDWPGEEPEPPKLVDGVWHTHFDYLGSFDAGVDALPPGSALAQHTPSLPEKEGAKPREQGIPEAVRKMAGQKVRVEGYMIPLEFDDGHVKTFFLSRYMMGCCFGVLPRANEVIEVTMVEGAKAYYDAYMPFIVTGTFEVVETGTDPEFLQSVFRMKADSCDYSEEW